MIRKTEKHIREIRQKLIEDNFENPFEKSLLVKQIEMLEKDVKYHQTGKIQY